MFSQKKESDLCTRIESLINRIKSLDQQSMSNTDIVQSIENEYLALLEICKKNIKNTDEESAEKKVNRGLLSQANICLRDLQQYSTTNYNNPRRAAEVTKFNLVSVCKTMLSIAEHLPKTSYEENPALEIKDDYFSPQDHKEDIDTPPLKITRRGSPSSS